MASAPPADPDIIVTASTVTAPTTAAAYVQPMAAWRVELDGRDLTEALRPRLVSLSLTEKRGEAADKLELLLHDSDGAMALPNAGATLTVALGWARGTGVTNGLVAKGRFKVDEVTWEGPPDTIRISASAADMASPLTTRRDASHVAQTLGAIVTTIARRHGLTPRVHASLAGIHIAAQHQEATSDIAFIRRLGHRYDAVATIKDGKLILMPIGTATTTGGRALPSRTISKGQCSRYSYTRKKRDEHDGAEASWHDQRGARRHRVTVGTGTRRRRLRRTYATEADARAAATAAHRRDQRAKAEMSLSLAYGEAGIAVESPVRVTGFKAAANDARWQVSEVKHSLDAKGFSTELTLDLGA